MVMKQRKLPTLASVSSSRRLSDTLAQKTTDVYSISMKDVRTTGLFCVTSLNYSTQQAFVAQTLSIYMRCCPLRVELSSVYCLK
eukprot:scaffold179303_cov20-Prasinocladus_malaysianus.AAC.1